MTESERRTSILKFQRGIIKRKLTSFEKALNDFKTDPDADFELLGLKHALLWDKFEKIQKELDLLTEDENSTNINENERSSFETRFFTLNGREKKLIRKQNSSAKGNTVIQYIIHTID